MAEINQTLNCYIRSITNDQIDPYLEERSLCHGLVMFSIPDLGIIFRCRVDGPPIDLEFAAFFSLLKFVKTQLVKQDISSLLIHSSNPEFVFSFSPQSRHLQKGGERERLLKEYLLSFHLQIRYVQPNRNLADHSPADFPSMPANRTPILKPDPFESRKNSFKPFQRGIKL